MDDPLLEDQINKRLTLNLLIQGSAMHAFLTSHYLVRDELNAINPKLIQLYDQVAASAFLVYWRGDLVLFFGRPASFWNRVNRPSHPFHKHRLLATHGPALAEDAKQRAIERCKAKGVSTWPVANTVHALWLLGSLMYHERGQVKPLLEQLAVLATQMIWGVPARLLHGTITSDTAFGEIRRPHTLRGWIMKQAAAGWSGVERRDEELHVTAKAAAWPLLSHELVKGTAELICMHGLSSLPDDIYAKVMDRADHIEYEPWMLQTGPELWRRLLPLLPDDRTKAQSLMQLARLPPRDLETLMFAVIEKPTWARDAMEVMET